MVNPQTSKTPKPLIVPVQFPMPSIGMVVPVDYSCIHIALEVLTAPASETSEAFNQLLAAARRYDMPHHYANDLLGIDRTLLEGENAPSTFLWGLRAYGTHLYDADDPLCYEHISAVQKVFEPCKWFLWWNGKLREITAQQALQFAHVSKG